MERFKVIVADPPWRFRDQLPGPKRGAAKHYSTLGLEEIARFDLPPLAGDCVLFLWRVASMPVEALAVVEEWGFEPKSEIVWVKTTSAGAPHLRIGMGRTVRNAHETCIVATRGRPVRRSASVPSVLFAPRWRHSAKPEAFFDLVEALYPGPYVELFARRVRPGWTALGNEVPAVEVAA